MPLKKSASPEAFKNNVREMVKAGHPVKQALAAAYATKRSAMHMKKKLAHGGKADMAKEADISPTGMEGCEDCYAHGGTCMAHGGYAESDRDSAKARYAEGGEVDAERPLHTSPEGDNPELDEADASVSMAPHELVDQDMSGEEESSMEEQDLPQKNEHISLASQIMRDRSRRMMARGGEVRPLIHSDEGDDSLAGNLHQKIDAPNDADMDHDRDELDAPMEDGRESRGLNAEPVHIMEDDEHDESDASLVAQILRDRRKRRMDD